MIYYLQIIEYTLVMKFLVSLLILLSLLGCQKEEVLIDKDDIPAYNEEPYIVINNDHPYFTSEEIKEAKESVYEEYGDLDELGRCTYAIASIDQSLMPTSERGDISFIHPTGWHSDRYNFVDQEMLYNRCHLIGRMLTGEDANENNLITGTRYMNTEGMLPFEELVAEHIDATDHHVLYRVTPIFVDDELVARGVLIEAKCTHDDSLEFCIFAYNVEPGVIIDYKTGDNWEDTSHKDDDDIEDYILNTNSKKFHTLTCDSVKEINLTNKQSYHGSREELLLRGYTPCGACNP